MILYTLVYGAMPFDGADFKVLRRQISNGDYYEPARPSGECGQNWIDKYIHNHHNVHEDIDSIVCMGIVENLYRKIICKGSL